MGISTQDHFDTKDLRLQQALRARVDAYFETTGLSRHANAAMVAKTVFFLGGTFGLLGLLSSGVLPVLAAAPVCLVLGSMVAFIGFNVGHDAIHGAYSSSAWINRRLGNTFDLLGGSSVTWTRAHNVIHHTYTNLSGIDSDLEPGPWLLFYPHAKPAWAHRFQHLYAPLIYALTMMEWLVRKDFAQALTPDERTGRRATGRAWVSLVSWKLAHLALFLGMPLAFSGYATWQVLAGYVAMLAATGLTLALTFQAAHVVEHVELIPAQNHPRRSWAEHQLRTTADFAPDSALVGFFCGGLNRQIEHHLFSRVCHIHYPALAPLVVEVAREFGVPHHAFPSFRAALASHFRTLKRFGTEAAPVLVPLPAVQPVPVAALES